jgi:hypothetical protein
MVILLYILSLYKMDVCCDRCDICLFSLVVIDLFCIFSLHVLEKNIQVMSLIFVADILPIYFCYLGIPAVG